MELPEEVLAQKHALRWLYHNVYEEGRAEIVRQQLAELGDTMRKPVFHAMLRYLAVAHFSPTDELVTDAVHELHWHEENGTMEESISARRLLSKSPVRRRALSEWFPLPLSWMDRMRLQSKPTHRCFPGVLLQLPFPASELNSGPGDVRWSWDKVLLLDGRTTAYVDCFTHEGQKYAIDLITQLEADRRQTLYSYAVRYKWMEQYLDVSYARLPAVAVGSVEEAAKQAQGNPNGALVVPNTNYHFGSARRWCISHVEEREAEVAYIAENGSLVCADVETGNEFSLKSYGQALVFKGKRLKYLKPSFGKETFHEWN